ncbi:MAG: AfsR/SARP family transcriptional regulator [Anaerolineae bacterium]
MVEKSSALPKARLFLLGTPHAEIGEQVVTFSHRKPLGLLAYLAVTRRIQSRETLATLLWPEHDTSRAYAYLRNAIWQLGQTPLGPWLITEQETVLVDEALVVDVPQLEAHLAATRAHAHAPESLCPECVSHLVEAVSLFQGDFMAGFTLSDSPDFEEWQFLQAEHLRQGAAYAMETLTRYHSARGDPDAALSMGRHWSALDPLNETAHRALMTLYAQTGQRGTALHQYETLLRNLRAARLEPSSGTVTLYRQIRGGEIKEEITRVVPETPTAPATPRHRQNLPAQTTAFVGRENELAELYDLLLLPECRLVTLTGPGGIGKTRLAIQAAYEQIGAFPDGVIFVALAPVTRAESMVLAIAEALGATFYPQSSISPIKQLLTYVGQKRTLLVLDNLEHLLEWVELLVQILEGTPNTKLLVTSRERLNVRGEWILELRGLPYPSEITPGNGSPDTADAASFDAPLLFIEAAQRIGADFEPDADELAAIARICRLVEGMPLGIELAAAWTKMLSCAEIAEEVETSLDFLTMTLRDLPERHQSLRAVFARSWGLLSEVERRSFRALAVFRGGFTREAAQIVAGADLSVLSSLMDKSLLRRTVEGRYEILEVLRQYAEEQLLAIQGETEAVRRQHALYYLRLLQRLEGALKGGLCRSAAMDQRTALDTLQRELDNIRSGWYWAAEAGEFEAIESATMSLALFCEMRGRFREGVAMFRGAENALRAQAGDMRTELLGLLLAMQGQFLCRYGHIREGCAILERAHDLLAAGPERASRALVQILSAYIGVALSPEEKQKRLESSLRTYQKLDDAWGIALSREVLGELMTQTRNYAPAESLLKESLALRRSMGDVWGTAMTLHALGGNEASQEKMPEALRYLKESIALREQIGDIRGVAICQTLMAALIAHSGDLATAQELHQRSVQGYQEVGDIGATATALAHLGYIARERGDPARARSVFESALERYRIVDQDGNTAEMLRQLGQLALEEGDLTQARRHLEEGLGIVRRLGQEQRIAGLQADLARTHEAKTAGDNVGGR